MASSEQLKLVIDVVNKNALKGMGDLKKAAKGVGDELDDTRTAAKRVAAELEKRADEMASDLKSSEKAAEALANALGPEMAAKIGDARLDSFIGDLKRAGLSFEEVEADAESFAQALRKMDAAADSVKNVDKAMARVGETSDNTRSVMANFTGNAISELPGVAGAFGPLNMAIGQFAEYAAEGNIALGSFLKAAGPIAGVAMGIKLFTDVMAENAQRAAEYEKRVKDLAEALREAREDGTSAAEALAKSWKDNGGKIEAEISNDTATLLEFGEATDDMGRIHDLVYPTAKRHVEEFSDELAAMGLTAEQFAELSQMSVEEIRRWGEGMVAAGYDAEEVNLIMQGAVGMHLQLADAAKADAVWVQVFGEKAGEAAKPVLELRTATEKLDKASRDLLGILDEQDAWASYAEALWAAHDGIDDTAEETRDLTRDTHDLILALEDVPEETKTELIVALQKGEQAKVDAWLAEKAKGITVPFYTKVTTGSQDTYGTRSHKASGGQVRAGVPYTVGEQGTEMFVPNTNGVVVPHGALNAGGGGGVVVNLYPRTMPTERELIDLINGIRRKQGGVI